VASYFNRLKTDLDKAAVDGIITPEQALKVWDHAKAESLLGGMKAVHWIAAAAGIFIAMGVALVVAHNWASIGAAAKMAAFLLLLAAAAEGSIAAAGTKPVISTALELLWFFLPAIGIGLYAQIFNLSGDPVRPYLLWAALSAPLAVLSTRPLPARLLTLLLFATLYTGTLSGKGMMALLNKNILSFSSGAGQPQPWLHWAAALTVLAAACAAAWFRQQTKSRGLALGAGLVWLFIMLCADTDLQLLSPAMLLLGGMSAAVLWLTWAPEEDEPGAGLPAKAWTAGVYAATFFWHYVPEQAGTHGPDSAYGTMIVWGLLGLAMISLALRRQRLFPEGRQENAAAGILLAASLCCAFPLFVPEQMYACATAVIANLILAALGAGLIISGARAQSEKLINRGVAILALTAITRFFDLFSGLLNSGMAFIAAGLAFAALAHIVNRGRKALLSAVKK